MLLSHDNSAPATSATPERLIAIDWSGALDPGAQRRGIWLADCSSDPLQPVKLRSGESRSAVEMFLKYAARQTSLLVAGIDFSFSYPAHFLDELGCRSAPEFWHLVAGHGERWLAEPHLHFWGRGRVPRPPGHVAPGWRGYRATQLSAGMGKALPRSSFQIGGAGAVGTGSLRGIPMLLRLREAGFSIWPFDPPRLPMLVEIYPRLLTGPVVKSRAAARAEYLRRAEFAALPDNARLAAEGSEDAFDALVSAWRMREHRAEFARLAWPAGGRAALEGAIWRPDLGAHLLS